MKSVREALRCGVVTITITITCTTMEVWAELTRRPSNTTRPMGVAAYEKRGTGIESTRREREHSGGNNE
jgi:hypothetical protein